MEDSSKNNKKCSKCKTDFVYFPDQCWWDYQGFTNTKLTKCPYCGCIQAVTYEKQINPNSDRRMIGR